MKIGSPLLLAAALLGLTACYSDRTTPSVPVKPVIRSLAEQGFPGQDGLISLQNPENRAVARCYNNIYHSAEDCATYLESNGYVRLRDIPYKTANFDFLRVDTYPTRRWRDSEITSRW